MIADELSVFLLVALHALGEIGGSEELILQRTRLAAWPQLTLPELQALLRRLADERHVVRYQPALSAARWRLTASGRATLQELNLI